MTDYISKNALFREFSDFVRASNNSDFEDPPTWNDAVSLVGSMSTIDAVPVVRCEECKYGGLTKKLDCWCERMEMYFKPDFFCADGARSESDE